MKIRFLSVVAGSMLLAACASGPQEDGNNSGSGSDSKNYKQGSVEHFMAEAKDRVFFAFDRSDLDEAAAKTLMAQAAWLAAFPQVKITIEGHADERGTREYNLALGERRANSVMQFLKAQGIAADRMTTITYGKERPAVTGSNDYAWSQNRRGVTVIAE